MNQSTDRLGTLKTDADCGVTYCANRARIWAAIYYMTRSALLVFSVLTSAQALEVLTALKAGQATFALLVTLLTGFDSWLKPGDKYRALYIANDEYNALRQELEFIDATDKEAVAAKLEEYRQIGLRLQKVVVP
jgi:hypothetical protein